MESGRWLLAFQLNVIMALMYCSWGIYISSPVTHYASPWHGEKWLWNVGVKKKQI